MMVNYRVQNMRTFLFIVAAFSLSVVSTSASAQEDNPNALPKSVTTVKPGTVGMDPPDSYEKLPDGLRLSDGDRLEVYVDVEGHIYQRRTYQGVVPRMNDKAAFSDQVKKRVQAQSGTKIMWIGFQQMLAASRVFIQTDRVVKYSLYKPNPKTIIVEFPRAQVPLKNNQRELMTGNFNTPVEMVRIVENKKTRQTRIVINLKRPVGYIYRQDGPYVYVDIER